VLIKNVFIIPLVRDNFFETKAQQLQMKIAKQKALKVGSSDSLVFLITPLEANNFIALSGDIAPIHINEDFAKEHGFNGSVLHGAHLTSKISKFIGLQLPGVHFILLRYDFSFHKPAYVNTEYKIIGEVTKLSPSINTVELKIRIVDKNNTLIVRGKTWHQKLENLA
jgi:3-hydroxybutyryl-CoA dehydratase